MYKKAPFVLAVSLLLSGFLASCGPTQAELDSQATKIVADIFATQTAQAPTQTSTPTLTQTATLSPSSTPIPPTTTSTPIPPTETPIPVSGDLIAYVTRRWNEEEVYLMKTDGSFQTRLTDMGFREINELVWSPDGQRLAFIALELGDRGIYVMNADGTASTRLTSYDILTFHHSLSWSRDGKWLAFEKAGVGKGQDIYVINARDGTELKNLTEANYDDKHPVWSPSSNLIAFASGRNPPNPAIISSAIYIMKADGSDQKPLIDNPYLFVNDVSPKWSPDGTKLAFVSDRTGDNELYVIDFTANRYMRISEVHAMRFLAMEYSWSPDGEWLAFSARVDSQFNIYVIKADGSGEMIRISDSPENDTDPVWSSDGTKIAFESVLHNNKTISIVSLDGSGQTPIVATLSDAHSPVWQPMP